MKEGGGGEGTGLGGENDRSGVVKIEQADSAPWLNSNTHTRLGFELSSLENTWIIRAQTPSYRVLGIW